MADDAILVERLLRVIDEGRRTATYKLALLLGLIDAVALSPGQAVIPTRLVAERVAFVLPADSCLCRRGRHRA